MPAPEIAPAPLPAARRVLVRCLFPFLIERRAAARAADAVCGSGSGLSRGLWARVSSRKLYRYRLGMTAHLDRLLFTGAEAGGGGAYLRAAPAETARWFDGVSVELPSGPVPVRLDPACGVELFLTALGAGVLSIALEVEGEVDLATAAELVSRLARLTRPGEDAPWLARPAEAPADGEGAPVVAAAAAPSSPLAQRLVGAGARFGLTEVVAQLLEPLAALDLTPIQDALCAYTIVRLGPEVDLCDRPTRAAVGPLVAVLAQLEDRRRAPAPHALGVPHLLVDAHHWAAASLQGSAHVVVDRPGEDADGAAALARDRWFVPYLAALVQRCAIKKAAEEAAGIVLGEGAARERVAALQSSVLEFAVSGALPEVSVRSSLHRYYRVCQRAADLRRNASQVRRAIADLEAQLSARQQFEIAEAQREIASRTAAALESSHRIHVALEWIEVFIVVAYAAELVKFFALEVPHIASVGARAVAIAAALVPGVVALAILRPWRHRHRSG